MNKAMTAAAAMLVLAMYLAGSPVARPANYRRAAAVTVAVATN